MKMIFAFDSVLYHKDRNVCISFNFSLVHTKSRGYPYVLANKQISVDMIDRC